MAPKIIIWGIGERTKMYLENGFFMKCEILGFVDSMYAGTEFRGKKVYPPSELSGWMGDGIYLVICNQFFSEIYALCLDMGIARERIIFTDWIDEPFARCSLEAVKMIEPKLVKEMQLNRYRLIEMNQKDTMDKSIQVGHGKYAHQTYMSDYFRYRSFEYMTELLEEDQVQGVVAEFGVFRGSFASLINQRFPDRKLYLFDTFEGFCHTEIEKETELGRCDDIFAQYHTQTSLTRMRDNLPFPEMCKICKGFFPDCVTEEATRETYAFVSIDVDFETSTYEGLKFFYPRLSEGGVIFLHDYNAAFLSGVKSAVKRYEEVLQHKLKKVPFADRAGTLVIIK